MKKQLIPVIAILFSSTSFAVSDQELNTFFQYGDDEAPPNWVTSTHDVHAIDLKEDGAHIVDIINHPTYLSDSSNNDDIVIQEATGGEGSPDIFTTLGILK